MQSYKLEYIRSYSYLVILKVVPSLFTIYFKLEKFMVSLQIHGCVDDYQVTSLELGMSGTLWCKATYQIYHFTRFAQI
jgi:hypothetical protein